MEQIPVTSWPAGACRSFTPAECTLGLFGTPSAGSMPRAAGGQVQPEGSKLCMWFVRREEQTERLWDRGN